MGRLVAYAFLCLILVSTVVAPPVPDAPMVVMDNLSNFPLEINHHFIYKDGSFEVSETETIESGGRATVLVDDPDIARVLTTYALLRPEPAPGLWNQNNSWSILEDGGPEDSTFWTIDDEGFWLADYDPLDNPEIEEVKMCDWRTTGFRGLETECAQWFG